MQRKIRNNKTRKWRARRSRVTHKLQRSERAQLRIFRSAKHIYAQIVDPAGKTVVSISTRSPKVRTAGDESGKIAAAKRVGAEIANAAKEKQIEEVAFHRNGFLYHGRVKALAEAAREAGLRF